MCRTICDETNPCRDDQTCTNAACVGTDRGHDPGADAQGGSAGTSGGAEVTGGHGGSNDQSEGGDAGESVGGSGLISNEGGRSAGGRSSGGSGDKGGHANGGSSGKGSGGNGGRGGAGGSTGSGGTGGSTGSGGTGVAGTSGAGGVGGAGGNSGSGGSCPNSTYQCISSPTTSQQCVNGVWGNNQVCSGSTPACFAGKCAECADPAVGCNGSVPRSCVNGAWKNGTACGGLTTCVAGACSCSATTCGSSCVNLQTDSANCGSCNHSCQTGTCTGGKCQPVTIVTGQNKPWSIATDGTTLFWVNQGNQTLIRYTLASGSSAQFSEGDCATATGGLALFASKLWWSAANGTCSVATPGTGTPTENKDMWGGTTNMLYGVAASANGAYTADPFDNWIVASFNDVFSFSSTISGIAADSAGVYWLEGTKLVKQHDTSPLFGSTPGVLSSGITTSEGITTYNSFVYFTGIDTIYRVPNTPGTAPTPLVAGQVNPSGIAVDASGIYWTNRAGGSVMRAPLTGATAAPIATGQNDPHGIALDSNTVYWTNTAGGQVMKVAK